MSILDDMKGSAQPYKGGQLSLEKLKEIMTGMYETNPAPRTITIHTGIGGLYTFDYCIADEGGMIAPHMKTAHAHLVRLDGYRAAVDENGLRWMFGWVKGKLYWSNMHQLCPKQRRPMPTRFIEWEAGNYTHKVRLTEEQQQYFLDRRKVKHDPAFRKEWMKEHNRMYY